MALATYAVWTHRFVPIADWFLVVCVPHWALSALFLGAALSAGWRLTSVLAPQALVFSERLTYALALGTLTFGLGVFAGGWLGWFGTVFFVAWPVLLIVVTAPAVVRDWRRIYRHHRRLGWKLLIPNRATHAVAAVGLLLFLVANYLLVVTPENVGWDARWYHLAIAEQYAAQGAIRRFDEGWYLGTYPQLATWLYTWAFQAKQSLFHRVLLASHIEWTLFLATLPGMAALARRVFRRRMTWASAALVLFPGILLYDSSLNAGADHVLAFWGPPLALAALRFWDACKPSVGSDRTAFETARAGRFRSAVLVAALISGALLTKYQALYFLIPVAIVVLAGGLKSRDPLCVGLWVATCALLTAPHWLKNVLLHGNPTYPLLHAHFPSRPFHEGAALRLAESFIPQAFSLGGSLWSRAKETAIALGTFSFIPHNWPEFHGNRPVFGSLFTLLVPAALLVRMPARAWALIVAVHLGIVAWYVTNHQDRFLQALTPVMAVCVAGIIHAICHVAAGVRVRGALVALIGFQLVWGGDVYFIRTHAMVGDSPLKPFADRVAGGHERKSRDRFVWHDPLAELSRELPPSARVLIHEMKTKLGIGRPTVVDEIGWQGLFDYVSIDTPANVFDMWRRLGVTHALWKSDRGDQSAMWLAREAVFGRTLKLHQRAEIQNAGVRLSTLATEPGPPAAGTPTRIVWLGCGGDPARGIYSPRALAQGQAPELAIDESTLTQSADQALRGANAAIVRSACGGLSAAHTELGRSFEHAINAGGVTLWVRRAGGGAR
ncbi:MAG TPA: hypothetical protein VGF45_24700 [Polyangia bacterium]